MLDSKAIPKKLCNVSILRVADCVIPVENLVVLQESISPFGYLFSWNDLQSKIVIL